MSDTPEDFDVVKLRVMEEFAAQGFGGKSLTLAEAWRLRSYAKSRCGFPGSILTTEQTIWKALYDGLTDELRKAHPTTMADLEALEQRKNDLEDLDKMVETKLKANPHDFGMPIACAFLVVGLVIGWTLYSAPLAISTCGLAFFGVGLLFAIFITNSADVQSRLAIMLYHTFHETRLSSWLYKRALTIR